MGPRLTLARPAFQRIRSVSRLSDIERTAQKRKTSTRLGSLGYLRTRLHGRCKTSILQNGNCLVCPGDIKFPIVVAASALLWRFAEVPCLWFLFRQHSPSCLSRICGVCGGSFEYTVAAVASSLFGWTFLVRPQLQNKGVASSVVFGRRVRLTFMKYRPATGKE